MYMLQTAVHPLQELWQVKNQADQLEAFHGKPMSYESYCNLLLSTASNYDAQYAQCSDINSIIFLERNNQLVAPTNQQ